MLESARCDMSDTYVCKYCNKSFGRKCAWKVHENTCLLNPAKIKYSREKRNETCPFCHKTFYTTVSAITKHINYCHSNPNGKIYKGHTFTDAQREKISRSMKAAIQEGRAHGWATTKDNMTGKSYPEVWFERMLRNEGLNLEYVYNMQFFQYKLDFAWPSLRLCIEVDGEQHELLERKASDEQKDKKLKDSGWRVLHLKWGFICAHSHEAIEIVRKFLTGCGNVTCPLYETTKDRQDKRRELLKSQNAGVDACGRYCIRKVTQDTLNKRAELILSCGIDLHKFGWVNKVAERTGLTRREIYFVVKRDAALRKQVYHRKSTAC